LVVVRSIVPVIIEADFADGDDFSLTPYPSPIGRGVGVMENEISQVVNSLGIPRESLGRMDPDCCMEHWVAIGQFDDSPAGGHAETRDQDAGDAGLFGAAQDLGPVGIEFLQIQMAVGVGEHVRELAG
jgi:hypothetical protein